MSERQRGDRSSDEAQDDQKNDSSKRDDPGGSRKQSRFGRIRARNNPSREEGPGAARNEDSEPEAGAGDGDGDESDGQGEGRDRAQPDVPPPRSPAQRLMEGGMATFDRMRKSLATNPKGGGEAKAEERQQQQQRGAVGGPGSTVSALAAGVMDRSSKLKSQMMSMMDRSGGGGRPAGDAAKGKSDAGKEGEDEDGADADDEDPLQPSSSPERRQPTIRRTGSRLQRLSQRNNKENAPGEEAGGAGGEPAALDKLTQRLKRRGLTRRSSKEAGETNRRSEEEDDEEEEDQEEPEHKAAASPDKAAASKPGVTFDPDRPYMRTVPTPALRARRQLLDRVMVEKVPELHIIGEITGALGFDSGISCRWILEMGKFWSHLAGEQYGQTHTVYPLPEDGDQALAVWNHPLDVHLTSASIQGWPRLIFQVSRLDELGRHTVVGYGFEHVPVMPGVHQLEVSCWRPTGSMQDELAAYFLGVTPQLLDTDVVFTRAWDKRCRLVTMPAGRIYLNLSIIARNFAEYDVDLM